MVDPVNKKNIPASTWCWDNLEFGCLPGENYAYIRMTQTEQVLLR